MSSNRFDSTDSKVLLATGFCRTGVFARRSTIEQERDENGGFASRKFGERSVVRFCHGLLAYGDLGRELKTSKQYEEKYIEATAQ